MRTTFHIGLHKTATTWLQERVFPRLGCYGGKLPNDVVLTLARDPSHFRPRRFRAAIRAGRLYSSEKLSGDPFNGTLHRGPILANLERAIPDARVVVFLRRQDSWARSLYIDSRKKGAAVSAKRLFADVLDGKRRLSRYPNPSRDLFFYSPLVQFLYARFGRGSCLVLPYESLPESVERVCSFLGEAEPEYDREPVNVAWDAGRVRLYGVMNALTWFLSFQSRREVRRAAGHVARRLGLGFAREWFGGKWTDRANVCGRILEICRADNERLYDLCPEFESAWGGASQSVSDQDFLIRQGDSLVCRGCGRTQYHRGFGFGVRNHAETCSFKRQ